MKFYVFNKFDQLSYTYSTLFSKVSCPAVTSPFKPQALPEGSYVITDSVEPRKFRFSLIKKIENVQNYGEGYWDVNISHPEYNCKK